jgi:hypothetical protein
LWPPDEFGHIFSGDTYVEEYQRASVYRKELMNKFAIGTQKFAQAYEYHSWTEGERPKRTDGYAYHAASSRRVRISDGPALWDEGQVVFAPPPAQPLEGTSPIFDFRTLGGRAQGGPGEAGTGSGVSAQ